MGAHLEFLGLPGAQKGQLIDARIQEAPKKRSLAPEDDETDAAKAQHDTDATFTKKGYKNHVSINERFGFARCYRVSQTLLHESQTVEEVFDERNTDFNLYANNPSRWRFDRWVCGGKTFDGQAGSTGRIEASRSTDIKSDPTNRGAKFRQRETFPKEFVVKKVLKI